MSTGPKPAIVPATELLEEKVTQHIIGAAIEVHRHLGPGLLESAYEECLCHELTLRQLRFRRQVELPVVYKSVALDCGYRMDVLVEDRVIVELKCVESSTSRSSRPTTHISQTQRQASWLDNSTSTFP